MPKIITSALLLMLVAANSVSPAFARGHHKESHRTMISGHGAYGMGGSPYMTHVPNYGMSFNPNSPAATGGGSLGYNEKLLED